MQREPGADQGPGPVGETGQGSGIAYAYLNRRERTVAEMVARLQRAEIARPEIEAVIEELLELGYLDDARYARVFTEDRRNLDRWGNERIARALRERGVDGELIAQALTAGDEHDELGQATALLHQRFPRGPTEPRDRDRAFGVLIRKGYGAELAADAVRSWTAGESPEEDMRDLGPQAGSETPLN